LQQCSAPLSLASEQGCGQRWSFPPPLYGFGSGFSGGEAAQEQGLQGELASLEELPAYCSCRCAGALYVCTNPANFIACPALFMGEAGSRAPELQQQHQKDFSKVQLRGLSWCPAARDACCKQCHRSYLGRLLF